MFVMKKNMILKGHKVSNKELLDICLHTFLINWSLNNLFTNVPMEKKNYLIRQCLEAESFFLCKVHSGKYPVLNIFKAFFVYRKCTIENISYKDPKSKICKRIYKI